MKIVILAAGRGTRMGLLTESVTKTLLHVCGKSILGHIFDSFNGLAVDEIIIVAADHNQEQIKNFCLREYQDLPIRIILQGPERSGTYAAVESAKQYLVDDFLVVNGDDIHTKDSLESIMGLSGYVFGTHSVPFRAGYYNIASDNNSKLQDFLPPDPESGKTLIATGVYKMNKDFFKYKPVKISGGEYGIPQTLKKYKDEFNITVFQMKGSFFINTEEDLNNVCQVMEKKHDRNI